MLGLLCGCSKEKFPEKNDREITIVPMVDDVETSTKAMLYHAEPDLRDDMFNVQAYLHGTDNRYFNSNMFYSDQSLDVSEHKWYFEGYKKFYWPLTDALDFFAYAPTSIPTSDESPYSIKVNYAINPPTFTAKLPLNNTETTIHQYNMKEFMCAYVQNKDKSTEVLNLSFTHPFAAIKFRVKQSQRNLRVNYIKIDGIEYSGTFNLLDNDSSKPNWTFGQDDANGDFNLKIDKTIPTDVNFGGDLCDYCLVLPQSNDGGKDFSIECYWEGYDKEGGNDTRVLTGIITNTWEASKLYTYELDLGNSREEILFEVSVEPWKWVYEHEIPIE